MADGLVELGKSFVLLSQVRHHQPNFGLGAPTFGLLALLLTEFGLLCGPLNVLLVVGLGTADGNEQVEDILLLGRFIAHRIVFEQRLADDDGRVLPLLIIMRIKVL